MTQLVTHDKAERAEVGISGEVGTEQGGLAEEEGDDDGVPMRHVECVGPGTHQFLVL